MKRLFLHSSWILCLLLQINATAQTPYLNGVFAVAHNAKLALEVTDSLYYVASLDNTNPTRLEIGSLDKHGNFLDTLVLQDSIWWLDNCPKCLHYHNSRLYYVATNFLGIRDVEMVFFTIDETLNDTIRSKTFRISNDSIKGQQVWATEFDSDSTFILTGLSARAIFVAPDSVLKYDIFVARFDTAYNLLWSTVIPATNQSQPYGPIGCDIELDAYGSLIVSGNPFLYAPTKMGFAARLRQSDGHLYWYKEYPGGQYGLWGMYCVDNGNGTYQFVQNWSTHSNGGNNQLNVGLIDTSGTILQQRLFLTPNREHAPVDLIKTSDGNFYTAGTTYYTETYSFGFKFTPTLDSLFAIDLYYDQIGNRSEVFNFQEEPSGGYIIHGGMYIGSSAPGVNSWLKRIDLQGCDTSNCGIGVRENPIQGSVVFYPNPADHQLTLEWERHSFLNQALHINVFDMAGRRLMDQKVKDLNLGMEMLDVSRLVPGTYILQLSTDDGFHQSETLIIQ